MKFSKTKLSTIILCEEVMKYKFLSHFCSHYSSLGIHPSHMLFVLHVPSKQAQNCLELFSAQLNQQSRLHELCVPYEMMEPTINTKIQEVLQAEYKRIWKNKGWRVSVDLNEFLEISSEELLELIKVAEEQGHTSIKFKVVERRSPTTNLNTLRADTNLVSEYSDRTETGTLKIGMIKMDGKKPSSLKSDYEMSRYII